MMASTQIRLAFRTLQGQVVRNLSFPGAAGRRPLLRVIDNANKSAGSLGVAGRRRGPDAARRHSRRFGSRVAEVASARRVHTTYLITWLTGRVEALPDRKFPPIDAAEDTEAELVRVR